MKIGITAPIYIKNDEHYKYLNLTTKSFYSKDHDIVFIPVENYIADQYKPIAYSFVSEPDETYIINGREPQSVAGGWNTGIRKAQEVGCDYVLVINADIVFKSNMIDRLVEFAKTHPEAVMWTASEYADLGTLEECTEDENFNEHPHFSCFMIKPDLLDKVGEFDENIKPSYTEDNDFAARMALGNQKAYVYGGARFFHFGSRTIKSDTELWEKNKITFAINQQYFLDKWGHPPVNDVEKMREVYFKTPFNQPELPLSYVGGRPK